MTERSLRYRRRENWGRIDELADDEFRSYADGSIRRFTHNWSADGKKVRRLIGARTPSEEEWETFFGVLDRYEAWQWTYEDIQLVPDAASWSLRIVRGNQELRIDQGSGFPSGYFEVCDVIECLVFGERKE